MKDYKFKILTALYIAVIIITTFIWKDCVWYLKLEPLGLDRYLIFASLFLIAVPIGILLKYFLIIVKKKKPQTVFFYSLLYDSLFVLFLAADNWTEFYTIERNIATLSIGIVLVVSDILYTLLYKLWTRF